MINNPLVRIYVHSFQNVEKPNTIKYICTKNSCEMKLHFIAIFYCMIFEGVRKMRIALYGKKMEALKLYKERLENKFNICGRTVKIDYYTNESEIKNNMQRYDLIVLSNSLLDEFTQSISDESDRNITFVSGKKIETCPVEDILYVEAELKKVHVWKKNEDMLLSIPISKLEGLLKKEGFIKSHRSYIVNSIHISSITKDTIILDNGIRIPVSKYRIKEVREEYLALIKRKEQYK